MNETVKRVLLVDDEVEFVDVLSMRLAAREIEVDSAATGTEALEKVRATKFDAIVLDLVMPGMDGIETLRELRSIDPDLQVILLSGHGTIESGVQAMKLGAMDFLEKPVKLDLLLDKIQEAKSRSDEAEEHRLEKIVEDIITTKGW